MARAAAADDDDVLLNITRNS